MEVVGRGAAHLDLVAMMETLLLVAMAIGAVTGQEVMGVFMGIVQGLGSGHYGSRAPEALGALEVLAAAAVAEVPVVVRVVDHIGSACIAVRGAAEEVEEALEGAVHSPL